MATDPGGFTVDLNDVTTTPTSGNYLSNGDYDIYNLGDLYDKQLMLGTVDTPNDSAQVQAQVRGKSPWTTTSIKTVSVEQMMQEFAGWSVSDPTSFAAMQQQLYNSGAYGSAKPNFGVYSSGDAAAMKKAMQGYLGVVNPNSPNPLTFADYLSRSGAQGAQNGIGGGGGGGGGASRAPLALTDPATLRQTLQQAAQNALHRNLDDSELAHFVDAFHGKEQQAYNSANGGATYSSPDAGAQAIETVQSAHADEAGQALKASYNDKMMSMLGGGS